MNVSNMNKLFLSVKKILSNGRSRWRHEVFRRHVAQAKRIFYFNIMLQKEEIYINKKEYAKSVIKYIDKI